jgi:3',5'-cyclic AMP phosphodiesterase CpdA
MPITFSSMKRREFLLGTFAAGLTAALYPSSVFAAENLAKKANHWVFLSDTHVPGDPNRIRQDKKQKYDPNKNFTVARDAVLKLADKPQGIIVTGDFAHLQGKPEDYRQLASLIVPYTEAGIPVHVALGNHDRLNNFHAAFANTKQENPPVHNKKVLVLETPNCNLFLLDSLFEEEEGSGYFGRPQRRWLAKELDARSDKPAILFAHHNREDLVDDKYFWSAVLPRKQVKAYIYGHTHVYRQSVSNNVHLINLPALGWEFAGGLQPLGWSDAVISENGIQLTLHTVTEHDRNNDVRQFSWLR